MVLVTRPNHDLPTMYLYYFSKEIIKYCQDKGISIFDLRSTKANKKNLFSYIDKNNIRFIVINGHGNENEVCGHDNETLIDKYEKNLENMILYCRSCKSAQVLGKRLVKGGVKVFVGYIKNYYVLMSRKRNTNPILDKTAKLFLDPSNLLVLSIIKGNSVSKADTKSKKLLSKNIKKIISSNMTDKNEVAAYLYHDLKCQVVIGQKNAKLY